MQRTPRPKLLRETLLLNTLPIPTLTRFFYLLSSLTLELAGRASWNTKGTIISHAYTSKEKLNDHEH